MRKIDFKKIGLAAMMLLSALTFQSCDNDNDTDWDRVFPNALVTVKKSGDACYLQLDRQHHAARQEPETYHL